MALSSVIRRTSSPVLPLAIRAIGCQTRFCGVVNFHDRSPRGTHQSHHYSSAATPAVGKKHVDEKLVKIISSQIKSLRALHEMPKDFPFSIQCNPSELTLELTRGDQDESVKIEIEMADLESLYVSTDVDETSDDSETNHDEDEDEDDNNDKNNDAEADNDITDEDSDDNDNDDYSHEEGDEAGLPMVVRITKGDCMSLQFHVTATPYNILIKNMFIKDLNHPADENDVPHFAFSDLDSRLKQAFNKYLEVRRITPSLVHFLRQYTINQNRELELAWLKKLKKFIKM